MNDFCLIPIKNFTVDKMFKLNDVYFSPPYTTEEFSLDYNELSEFTDSITQEEFEQIHKMVLIFCEKQKTNVINTTLAIIRVEELNYTYLQEAYTIVDKICDKVDRSMDYFRIAYCQVGNFDTLPGLPGIVSDGFKTIYQWNADTDDFSTVPGEVTIVFQKGIGLMPSREPILEDYQQIIYKCLFSTRNDEVFLNCRSALTRVNEAMYMPNLNASFIYLMTTLEMLADKDKQVNFAKVKPRILPFIIDTKNRYHDQSNYMRYLSESIRTEIVHNGKNILDLYENREKVVKDLFRITGMIVNYVEAVWSLDVRTFVELEKKRSELIKNLGV